VKSKIAIIVAGYGRVGKEFCRRIECFPHLSLKAVFRSAQQLVNLKGITANEFAQFRPRNTSVEDVIGRIDEPTVLIDATADKCMLDDWLLALKSGASVITANKLPLCMPYNQCKVFFESYNRVRFEATVGAGLPVIQTLRNAVFSEDYKISFEGCLSGTLAYIFDAIKKGEDFASAVKSAHSLGYTEPDPREDLAATDLARKALIMNRVVGGELEMENLVVQSLVPDKLRSVPKDDFLARMDQLELPPIAHRMNAPRFVISGDINSARVEIVDQKVYPGGTPTDNDFCMRSNGYPEGIRILGPGAGPAVTAMALLSDLETQIKTL
tara:strand:- start:5273 stop:6250 length:978 start_codon:yes stop_codon:yes gene_type:complete